MRQTFFFIFTILTTSLLAQIEIPTSSPNCKILSKNNFTYCLEEGSYKTQWTAVQIKGTDIENKVYLPPDIEFFKDLPASISFIWQNIETQTKFWAMDFDSVFVVTGFAEIELDSLPVKAYYKAILKGSQGDALAFFVDTKSTKTDIASYGISINKLEELTGMDFFPTLNKDLQDIFESKFNWEFWPILVE